MSRLIVVSNRVSVPSQSSAAGGLAVAIRDLLAECGGLWFGWSGKIARRSSNAANVLVRRGVTYATVNLSPTDHHAYYNSYSNSTLWPLLHYRLGLVAFDRAAFQGYLKVNRNMAAMLRPFLDPSDIIWVHDYHLIPLGAALRELGISNRIGFFLHTPFPTAEVFSSLPQQEVLLQALAAYDLIGLQTPNDARALTACMEQLAISRHAAPGQFSANGRTSHILPFPIGIDTGRFAKWADDAAHSADTGRLRDSLAGRALIIGADRLDYSKALPNRFTAVEKLLTEWPEMRGKFTYVQITPPSRSDVSEYQSLRHELESAAGRVNGKFGDCDWTPIRYVNKSAPRTKLAGYYRLARVGLVTPFRDGMNLVAKEFVAAQDPKDPGALVLSKFAGAAYELRSALLVNPYDTFEIAAAIKQALNMPIAERRNRWQAMMNTIELNTISGWRKAFLATLVGTNKAVLKSDNVCAGSLVA
jgi:trehalose 6-phosphate synthase